MTYQAARPEQITFLGELMLKAGYATDLEIAEYQANLIRLGANGDPYASQEYVLELIDHTLDQLENHYSLQRLTEEIRSGEWKLEEGGTVPFDESSFPL